MKLLSIAALALFTTAPVFASSSFLLDFEKNWDYTNGDINGYYGGGTAADGSAGADVGVSFVNVSGLSNDANFTYYSGAPSMVGTAYAHSFAPQDQAFMNVSGGVDNALSFFYSSPVGVTGAVRAYSGLNGSGALLGTLDLAANASPAYDGWTQATLAFNGTARSFDLTNSANGVAFDNIAANISAVPEPSAWMLMLLGGACLMLRTARRRA